MRILIHNLSLPLFRYVPEAFDFDQNAFFFAESNDIVVTRRNWSSLMYRDYLYEVGAIKKTRDHIVGHLVSSDSEAVFNSTEVKRTLHDIVQQGSHLHFDSYVISVAEERFAHGLGLTIDHPASLSDLYNNKLNFKRIARELDLKTPISTGVGATSSFWMRSIFLGIQGVSKFVTKHSRGTRGRGSILYSFSDLTTFERYKMLKKSIRIQDKSLLSNISRNRIIEEWRNDVVVSPSVHYNITENGIGPAVIHIQKIEHEHIYHGCRSHHWLDLELQERLVIESNKLAVKFFQDGVRGVVGFDSIVTRSGHILWLESNVRKVMTSYSHKLASRITKEGQDMPYQTLDFSERRFSGYTPELLLHRLKPILCERRGASGVVPYNLALLQSMGNFSIAIVASTKNESDLIVEELRALLDSA